MAAKWNCAPTIPMSSGNIRTRPIPNGATWWPFPPSPATRARMARKSSFRWQTAISSGNTTPIPSGTICLPSPIFKGRTAMMAGKSSCETTAPPFNGAMWARPIANGKTLLPFPPSPGSDGRTAPTAAKCSCAPAAAISSGNTAQSPTPPGKTSLPFRPCRA